MLSSSMKRLRNHKAEESGIGLEPGQAHAVGCTKKREAKYLQERFDASKRSVERMHPPSQFAPP